jgi:hypothetical protein
MIDRTIRTIWEGRCPICQENGAAPESTDPDKTKSLSRWCDKCKVWIDCFKVTYIGPKLEPMVPDVHHIWCNDQKGPVKGCRFCAPKDGKGGYKEGFWTLYPYDPKFGVPRDLMKRHFPNNIERT